MTYKQCLKIAATYLNDDKLLSYVNGEQMGDDFTDGQLKMLASCADLVVGEIACEYYPLIKTELFVSVGGTVAFVRFSESVVDVYSVKRDGKPVPYKVTADGVQVEGKVQIEYSYAPALTNPTLTTIMPFKGGPINARVIGLGMAAEYCAIIGRSDEAIMLDGMFRKAITKACAIKRNLKLKKRRWC